MIPQALHGHYDNLLRCFYAEPIDISEKSIESVLSDVVGLVDVAEYMGSVGEPIKGPIERALMKQNQNLYRSIASDPISWAKLAYRVKLNSVMQEAVVHLVGQWNRLSDPKNGRPVALSGDALDLAEAKKLQDEASEDAADLDEKELKRRFNILYIPKTYSLHPRIRLLCEQKHRELNQKKTAIEMRIVGHYPKHIRKEGEASSPGAAKMRQNVLAGSRTVRGAEGYGLVPTKVRDYKADVLGWMAMNLFRHWVAQHLCGGMSRFAEDGGYDFYMALHKGGDAYLDHEARERFVGVFPLSAKGRVQFDQQMRLMKDSVRPFVKTLVEVNCDLDVNRSPVTYLVCAKCGVGELPWEADKAKEEEMRKQRLLGPPISSRIRISAENSSGRRNAVDLGRPEDQIDTTEKEARIHSSKRAHKEKRKRSPTLETEFESHVAAESHHDGTADISFQFDQYHKGKATKTPHLSSSMAAEPGSNDSGSNPIGAMQLDHEPTRKHFKPSRHPSEKLSTKTHPPTSDPPTRQPRKSTFELHVEDDISKEPTPVHTDTPTSQLTSEIARSASRATSTPNKATPRRGSRSTGLKGLRASAETAWKKAGHVNIEHEDHDEESPPPRSSRKKGAAAASRGAEVTMEEMIAEFGEEAMDELRREELVAPSAGRARESSRPQTPVERTGRTGAEQPGAPAPWAGEDGRGENRKESAGAGKGDGGKNKGPFAADDDSDGDGTA